MLLVILYYQVLSGILVSVDRILFFLFLSMFYVKRRVIIYSFIYKKNFCDLNLNIDVVDQYRNRCEIYVTIVKIKPLHAHLNHMAEKCSVHLA